MQEDSFDNVHDIECEDEEVKDLKEEAEKTEQKEQMLTDSRKILWLREITKKDVPSVGGKGANLGEMFHGEFPVPNAFVITSGAFKEFLYLTHLKPQILSMIETIDFDNSADVEEKAAKIREMVKSSEIPEDLQEAIVLNYEKLSKGEVPGGSSNLFRIQEPIFVAVRSSATAEDLADTSFAGQQETFLNMKGKDQVLEAVKKCWASLYTGRSIYYRHKNKISEDTILIAVVVQKMMNSEKSGVMFTANPLTNNKQELVIEAVFGLGEGIVSGSIEPDHFVIDKEKEEVKEKRIGHKKIAYTRDSNGKTIIKELHEAFLEKEVLYTHELKQLIKMGKKIEEHYDFPQDIEFAFESGNLYIVQSRPITTLEKGMDKQEFKEGKVLLEGLAASHGVAAGRVRLILDLKDLSKLEKGEVLVTKMTNPDMVVGMQKSAAIVTDEGGATCHAAIVSREMGIPCVVGTKKATSVLKEGGRVTVDGTNGKVYAGDVLQKVQTSPQQSTQPLANKKDINPNVSPQIKSDNLSQLSKPKIDLAGMLLPKSSAQQSGTLVKVNCDLPEVAERAAATGADGVGLIRIEFIIAEGGVHPSEYIRTGQAEKYSELLAYSIEKIAHAFEGKPVWIRTSDIRTDEYKSLKGADKEPKETNPMIGWHGIRRSLDDQEILKAEFKAVKMLHDKGYNNVGVMLPFVIRAEEVKKAKEICRSIGIEPRKDLEFGVMIETPGSCMIIEELCNEGIDFISFGTNDLTQLTLGIDRDNERIAPLFDEMHPGVLRMLEMVITVCKMYGVKTSICGQAGSRPEMAKFLAKKGISSISANIDAVQEIRQAIQG